MTTIAAITVDGVTAIAADGLACSDTYIIKHKMTKIFATPSSRLVACSGDITFINIVQQILSNTQELTATCFVEQLQEAFYSTRWKSVDDVIGAPIYGQEALYVDASGLYGIGSDLSITEIDEGFPFAIGTGQDFAIGAMESVMIEDYEPRSIREIVEHGVIVAKRRDSNTGGGLMVAVRGGPSGCEDFGPRWVS